MILSFLFRLFGCQHRNTAWPRIRTHRAKGQSYLYLCCLDCGSELDYHIGEHIFATPCKGKKRSKQTKELAYLEKLVRKE